VVPTRVCQNGEHDTDRLPTAVQIRSEFACGDVPQILSGTRETTDRLEQRFPTKRWSSHHILLSTRHFPLLEYLELKLTAVRTRLTAMRIATRLLWQTPSPLGSRKELRTD